MTGRCWALGLGRDSRYVLCVPVSSKLDGRGVICMRPILFRVSFHGFGRGSFSFVKEGARRATSERVKSVLESTVMSHATKREESISPTTILVFIAGFVSGNFFIILIWLAALVTTGCSTLPISVRNNEGDEALCTVFSLGERLDSAAAEICVRLIPPPPDEISQ